ncbi:hypothetical protein SAMN05444170_6667 [Bradyrhizobium erythrophlei]|uniref:Uncharacterized protein n=1 Tax=Bradyrhizobium erythrophlei TaxID=1437360 RepID=A0A1M7UTU5_9BRAD|nr:hypothetical protein SAMN05444170_6667 [Bradyrhizobium erythrophlei]
MVRRPTSCCRLYPFETHLGQVERVDKHVDHTNRVALVNKIIKASGQQRPLPTIRLLNEAPHRFLQESLENHNSGDAFSHSQGQKATSARVTMRSGSPSEADIVSEVGQVR